jgi:hypothetical protein
MPAAQWQALDELTSTEPKSLEENKTGDAFRKQKH